MKANPVACSAADHSAVPAQLPTNTIPFQMQPGAVCTTIAIGTDVILVGVFPSGLTAILCPKGWRKLQQWKLTRFRIVKGSLRACGQGRASGFDAARFLLDASHNSVVRYRNGNPLDIRLSNIVAVSRGLLKQAKIEESRGPDYGADVTLRDGRRRPCRRPMSPSAGERIAQKLAKAGP